MNNKPKRETSKEADIAGNIVLFFILAMIVFSCTGIWLKLFWYGWVLK